MEKYELEDLQEKVTYHCAEIEKNLELIDSLVESLDIDTPGLNIVGLIRTFHAQVKDKFEQEIEKLERGDDE